MIGLIALSTLVLVERRAKIDGKRLKVKRE
jgi:hypothetical protein